MQLDAPRLAVVLLDRRLLIHERDDGLAVPGRGLLVHDHEVTRQNAFVAHGFALHPQREVLPTARHGGRHVHQLCLGNRLDRIAGGHNAGHGKLR